MNLIKKTSLQDSEDVTDTLTWKVQTIKDKGLPVESGLADYIDLAVTNLTNELNYMTDVKAQVTAREKAVKKHIETIKVEGAVFLENLGCDKLEGVICSSVSINKAKDAGETTTTAQVFTMLISDEEMKELLIALGKAEMRTVTTNKETKAIPAKLRINKRKTVEAEVIES